MDIGGRALMLLAAGVLGCSGPNPAFQAPVAVVHDAPVVVDGPGNDQPVVDLPPGDEPIGAPDISGTEPPPQETRPETPEPDGGVPSDGGDDGSDDLRDGVVVVENPPEQPVDAAAPPMEAARDLAGEIPGPVDVLEVPVDAETINLGRGLVGYWAFDEGMGTSTRDRGSGANDGVFQGGPTWLDAGCFPASFGNPACLSFDGVNDHLLMEANGLPALGAAQSFSLWAWFAAPLPNMVRKTVVAYTRMPDDRGVQVGFESGRAAVWLWGDNESLVVSEVLAAQRWHHIAYLFDGTNHQLVVNGMHKGMTSRAQHAGPATALRLASYGGSSQVFPGRLDDVRLYDRLLNAAEVAALADGQGP